MKNLLEWKEEFYNAQFDAVELEKIYENYKNFFLENQNNFTVGEVTAFKQLGFKQQERLKNLKQQNKQNEEMINGLK